MATKVELEAKVKKLTDEVRTLRSETKDAEANLDKLTHSAYSVIKKDDGFSLVTVKFDPTSNTSAIDSVKLLGKSLGVASTTVKNSVIDELIRLTKEK